MYLTENDRKVTRSGFTVVELVVVILVIAIIATITVVGYGSWRRNVEASLVKSDLTHAATAMQSAKNFADNGYPSTLPATFTASDNVQITVSDDSSSTGYCLDAILISNPSTHYFIESYFNPGVPTEGTCATRPGLPSTPGALAATGSTTSTISLSWDTVADASGYEGQCASDEAYTQNVGAISVAGTTGQVTGLQSGTLYYCRIRAVAAAGPGAYSSISSMTAPGSVLSVVLTKTTNNTISLSWDPVVGAVSYQIQVAIDSGFNSVQAVYNTTTNNHPSIVLGGSGTYYIRIRAKTSTGVYGLYSVTKYVTVS